MTWNKLVDLNIELIERGSILRMPASKPYEDFVDFMLIVNHKSPSGISIVVASGYKAGLIVVNPPEEASGAMEGLLTSWLKLNWNKWVYESNVASVMVSNGRTIQDPNAPP